MDRGAALTAVVLLAGACGPSGGAGVDMAVPGDLAPAVESCQTDNMKVALRPRYAVRGALNVNIKVRADCAGAGCILDKDAVAQLLLLADIVQNGQTATVTARPCKIIIPPVELKGQPMPTRLVAAEALVQSVQPVTSKATLSSLNTCADFKSDPIAIVLGARLALPASDPLPGFSAATMPPVKLCGNSAGLGCDKTMEVGCVCDQDGDAKLGATVGATGVPALDDVDRVYLALRTVVSLDGVVFPSSAAQPTPGQRLKGTIGGLRLDQSPVGCHETPQNGAAPRDCDVKTVDTVAQLNPLVTQSTARKSTFVALPVADGYTCAELVANEATLFKGQ